MKYKLKRWKLGKTLYRVRPEDNTSIAFMNKPDKKLGLIGFRREEGRGAKTKSEPEEESTKKLSRLALVAK